MQGRQLRSSVLTSARMESARAPHGGLAWVLEGRAPSPPFGALCSHPVD